MHEDKSSGVFKSGINKTNQQTNLGFKANIEKYKSPGAFVLFQCEVLVGKSCFPLFHPPWWALLCAHPVPVSFQLSQAWWRQVILCWWRLMHWGFFLMCGFLARSAWAAGSKCGNSGRLDGSPRLLELCWSRVAPGEENKEEEEKEERIQAWALLAGSSGFLSARDMAEMLSCRAPCPLRKGGTRALVGVQSLLKQGPCVGKSDPVGNLIQRSSGFFFSSHISLKPQEQVMLATVLCEELLLW